MKETKRITSKFARNLAVLYNKYHDELIIIPDNAVSIWNECGLIVRSESEIKDEINDYKNKIIELEKELTKNKTLDK